jgi:putative oxidoreductase
MTIPVLDHFFAALAPVAYALLRFIVGFALIPHGLRMTFGFFPNTGQPVRNLTMLAEHLDHGGFRPARLWAPLISLTELVAGPMLALGLLTRLAAIPIVIFLIVSCFERWRVGKYFWNKLGIEYTLMWLIAAFYVLVNGSGFYSLDTLLFGGDAF